MRLNGYAEAGLKDTGTGIEGYRKRDWRYGKRDFSYGKCRVQRYLTVPFHFCPRVSLNTAKSAKIRFSGQIISADTRADLSVK